MSLARLAPCCHLRNGAWDAALARPLAMMKAVADLDVDVTLSIVREMNHQLLLVADANRWPSRRRKRRLACLARL